MVDLNIPEDGLSEKQKEKIIKEIEYIKWNQMRVDGDIDEYDQEEFIKNMKEIDDEDLSDKWFQFVGKWLISRTDLDYEKDDLEWVKKQWNRVLADKYREYRLSYQN